MPEQIGEPASNLAADGGSQLHPDETGGKPGKTYRVGTLEYTVRQLAFLFLWLLAGDFCWMLFQTIFFMFMPVYMQRLHADNTTIAVVTGSTAGMVNLLFLPNISIWTDRYRSRLGRRVPFLLWSTPLTVTALVLIGYAPNIGAWVHADKILPLSVSLTVTVLGVLTVFVVLFHFFNMVLVNSYYFLLRDVVPQSLMPRFLAWFRVVGTLGAFVLQFWLFQYVVAYPKVLFWSIGLVYLVSFLLMCWRVKEGGYPPPPPRENRRNFIQTYGVYFRECLSIPLYRNFFIAFTLMILVTSPAISFMVLFGEKTLGLNADAIGKVFAWSSLASAILYIPMGYLCEKFNAFHVVLASLISGAILTGLAYFFVQSKTTWLIYAVLIIPPTVGWMLGWIAVMMLLFPGDRFGQFSSGLNVLGYGSLVVTSYLLGSFMDWAHNFRMIFALCTVLYAAAAILMLMVYCGWKRHGGPDNYVPPEAP